MTMGHYKRLGDMVNIVVEFDVVVRWNNMKRVMPYKCYTLQPG